MQIKKNARDESYQDPPAYAEAQPGRVPVFETPDTVQRTNRGRDESGDETTDGNRPSPARAESVIDAGSTFDGRYEAGQDLRILGQISGEIICRGLLTVERDATAKARIQTRDAQVRGRLEGDIVCSGRLLLTATAVVTGTIKTGTMVMEEGANVSGTVQTVPGGVPSSDAVPTPIAASDKDTGSDNADSGKSGGSGGSGGARWRTREAPNFALVSSEERAASDRS